MSHWQVQDNKERLVALSQLTSISREELHRHLIGDPSTSEDIAKVVGLCDRPSYLAACCVRTFHICVSAQQSFVN